MALPGFRRRQLAWVFCRRDVWHSGVPQACWRLPMRASGRNHRRQIAHGLFRASGMVMLQVTTHWLTRVQVRMPGSVLESRGGSILASAEVVAQAKRFSQQIADGVKRSTDVFQQAALDGLKKEMDTMIPRVQQVVRQTRTRIVEGITDSAGKIVSLFEHTTEIIRKGKAGKPTEFGKMVKIQEAENQIITSYAVYPKRPADSNLLIPTIEQHRKQLGVVPRLVAGDAGFFSAANETAAQKMGVARVAVPYLGTKSSQRRQRQRERWFRKAQKWRTGCEGRISVIKRRHGLNRCRYKGDAGMQRWVGLGVFADTLINIGRVLTQRRTPKKSKNAAP